MKDINFTNMFTLGDETYSTIKVPDESAYVEELMKNIYNLIIKYFKDESKDVKILKSILEAANYIFKPDFNRRFVGSELANSYKAINYSQIENFFDNIDVNYYDTFGELNSVLKQLLSNIFRFAAFKFNSESITPDESRLSNDIYKMGYIGGDESKPYYYFKANNNIFDLLDKITNNDWSIWKLTCDPKGLRNKETTGYGLKQILLDGYYINSRDNEKYYLFEKEEEIAEFLLSLSGNEISIGLDSRRVYSWFTLDLTEGLISMWIEKILNGVLNKLVENRETGKYTYFYKNFGDSSSTINIKIPGDEHNQILLNKYYEIYKYAVKLFSLYLKKMENKTGEVRDDKNVKTLLEKITGSENTKNFISNDKSMKSGLYSNDGLVKMISDICVTNDKLSFISRAYDKTAKGSGTNVNFKTLGSSQKQIDSKYSIRLSDFDESDFGTEYDSSYIENFFNSESLIGLKSPIQFYELNTTYKEEQIDENTDIDELQRRITEISYIGGNIISKIAFFGYYKLYEYMNEKFDIKSKIDKDTVDNLSVYSIVFSEPSVYTNQKFEQDATVFINDSSYKTYEKAYGEIGRLVFNYLSIMCDNQNRQSQTKKTQEAELKNAAAFDSYVKSRFANNNYFTESSFFYLQDGNNRQKVPTNSFVDIEFKVPSLIKNEETGKEEYQFEWLPVTSIRNYADRENLKLVINTGVRELNAGSYFDSLELKDEAGVKKITLTLKSVNDINLENIIFSSLSTEQSNIVIDSKTKDLLSYINDLLKDGESNFRVRFGYRDRASSIDGESSTISTMNPSNKDFIERTKVFTTKSGEKFVKPVQTYPWTYFKITGINSSIKSGQDSYTIEGVSSGSYVFNNLSLCGTQLNFSGPSKDNESDNISIYYGKPRNVIGKLAKWIAQASCYNMSDPNDLSSARIVFLGDKPGTIISGYDFNEEKILTEYRYDLKDGENFEGGNLETVENAFFDSNQLIDARNFSIENNYSSISLSEIIARLSEWLPDRIYYIARTDDGKTAAIYLTYKAIYGIGNFFSRYPFKSEKITYQIIEADARIYKKADKSIVTTNYINGHRVTKVNNSNSNNNSNNSPYHKVYFIRMYYKGPGLSASAEESSARNNNYLRVYNYRSVQNQVIDNIELSENNAELGNLFSSVTLLGTGKPVIFTFNRNDATMSETTYDQQNQNTYDIEKETRSTLEYGAEGNIKPFFSINNSKYVQLEDFDENNNEISIFSNKEQNASEFFTSQQNKEYTGEITILGDPFYYFDSSVEAGKYEIYLQMNRVSNRKTYAMEKSKYTGIYFLTGIKHNIDSSGKYTTTLSVAKRIFGVNENKKDEEDDSSDSSESENE